jgi:collagenase-like PrtC family protease
MARDPEWTIEAAPGGRFDVFCDRRPVVYDRDDLDEAIRYARQRGAEEVVVVEPDGYRRTVRGR